MNVRDFQITPVGCDANNSWSSGSRRQLQIYKVYVNVVVVARSQSSVENAFKEIEQLCKEIVKTDSLPDTKQNRKYLENLTDQQVWRTNHYSNWCVVIYKVVSWFDWSYRSCFRSCSAPKSPKQTESKFLSCSTEHCFELWSFSIKHVIAEIQLQPSKLICRQSTL